MKRPQDTISLLKQRDDKTVAEIYQEYRNGFLMFARRYDLEEQIILDVYQDAIIALCENAEKGHLDDLKSSLKTYLFSIGKYMIFARLKEKKSLSAYEDIDNFNFEWEEYKDEENKDAIKKMRASLSEMGNKCQEILKLFYYQEKNLDEITGIMKYDNKDVTKSQKSRCIKQLKELINNSRNG